jgi:sigma-E factor negative regulatory protein RseA
MTDKIRAQISALVDNELRPHEWDLLAKRLRNDAALRQTWEHYHLIGDAIQGPLAQCDMSGFSDGVMAKLTGENQSRPVERKHGRTAGLAVAASVAALAVIGLAGYYGEAEVTQTRDLAATPAAAIASTHSARTRTVRWNRKPVAVQRQLNNLLINHADYISNLRRHTMRPYQTMLPYLHIAAYDPPFKTTQPPHPVIHTVADDSPSH